MLRAMRKTSPQPRVAPYLLGAGVLAATFCAVVMLIGASACSSTAPLSRVPDSRDAVPTQPPGVTAAQAAEEWSQAQDVLERRCVVCHGCYDAPCQLKLDSYAGVVRGASPEPVYDGARLRAATPTRLSIDAHLVSEWRSKGFHAVIPESPQYQAKQSVLVQMLALKRAHPMPPDVDFGKTFTLDLDRAASCVKGDDYASYASEHPQWGMPYALPAITADDQKKLEHWVDAGAPNTPERNLPKALLQAVDTWETYLNDPSPKRKLSARYIYEHLFLASLYFKDVDDSHFFRLVRSRSPHGFPVDEVPTRRPFEDPEGRDFYYRIQLRDGVRLAKTHMPYPLDAARLERWHALFDTPNYTVDKQPSYDIKFSSNPFRTFETLPVASRYQFLLDDAEFFMMGFIKGPVCRGQVALNVIQERFWIAFLDPDSPFATKLSEKLADLQTQFELPAKGGSNALPFRWFAEAEQHSRYVQARNDLWAQVQHDGTKLDTHLIWDGDGKNSNAGLTVIRHFDSATVVRGFVGGPSQTAWVVDYPMFERIHYLLVAGFDVFGNVGHQITTRLYMDFLRMEGEANYMLLLPVDRRAALAAEWYRDMSDDARKSVLQELVGPNVQPDIRYKTAMPELELDAKLEQHLNHVLQHTYDMSGSDSIGRDLLELTHWRGSAANAMPELSFLEVERADGPPRYYSIVRDSAHTNVAELFHEADRRVAAEDQLRIVPGFLGAYPNAIFHVGVNEHKAFLATLGAVKKPEDYAALRQRFGVLRGSNDFWSVSDRLYMAARAEQPLTSGLFDYNRLQAP